MLNSRALYHDHYDPHLIYICHTCISTSAFTNQIRFLMPHHHNLEKTYNKGHRNDTTRVW